MSALAWPFGVITGKCVQLNSISDLLDGYKKVIKPRQRSRQSSCEALLVGRPKSVKTIDSTVRLNQAGTPARDISIDLSLYF